MQKLNWREKYSAILVLLIGIIILITQVSGVLSSKANAIAIRNGSIIIDKSELLNDSRSYLTILLGILGGILLLRNKRLGWVIGMPLLLLFTIITSGISISSALHKDFSMSFKMFAAVGFLLLLAAIFLLVPSTQAKYRVGKGTWLPTLLFFMLISAIYFFLQ